MSRRSYNSAQSDRMEDVSYLSYSDERGDRGRQQRHQPGANFFDPHPDPVAASAPTSVRANSFSALDSSAKTTPRVSAASFPGSSGILKPKHFETPLTCWFWSQGHCNKSHGECLYAHYDTGIVAEQPVRFGSASGGGATVLAGAAAVRRLQTLAERERAAEAREETLAAREAALAVKKDRLKSLEKKLKRRVDTVFKEFAALNKVTDQALSTLERQADHVQLLHNDTRLTYAQKYEMLDRLLRRTTSTMCILQNQMGVAEDEVRAEFASFLRRNRFAADNSKDAE